MSVISLSRQGLEFLKRHEGFRDHMYNDTAGHCTVGYGHLVHRGHTGSDPVQEAPFVRGLPEPAAAVYLTKDTQAAQAGVRTWVTRPLQQTEFDALVSFTFNVGVGALAHSTLTRRINSLATPDAIEQAWLMWRIPPSVLSRRRDECALFLEGNYGGPVS